MLKSELISLDRDCHDEELTGYICHVTDYITSMHLYTNDGEYDGFTVFETEQITEVYWGNREQLAIAKIISKTQPVITPSLKSEKFQDVIIELNEKFDSICLHESGDEDMFDIIEIEKHDEYWFKVLTFGIKKSLSRMYKLLQKEAISRVVVNSPYQNNIVLLHDEKI